MLRIDKSMQIRAHRLVGCRQRHSPNCNDRPNDTDISLLVIHGISLPPGHYGGPHIDQLFCNRLSSSDHPYFSTICGLEVSSHLLIRRDGETIQYVPFDQRAWHAGQSRYGDRENCNDFSIGIELEGTDDAPYETEQYRQLAKLSNALIKTYPLIRQSNKAPIKGPNDYFEKARIRGFHIVGHSDIAPARKTDPGSSFDWECYQNLLNRD